MVIIRSALIFSLNSTFNRLLPLGLVLLRPCISWNSPVATASKLNSWQAWQTGLIDLQVLSDDEINLVNRLMDRYQDHPMDLADATLVAVADFRGWRQVFTVDTDFFAYRLRDGSSLDVLLPTKE